MESIKEIVFKVDISVSIFGIRNLIRAAKKPIFKFKLTNGKGEELKSEEVKKDRYKEEKYS